MTQVGSVYGEALYSLALEDRLTGSILSELEVLDQCFQAEPEYLRLLSSPSIPKQERCRILDDSFRGKVHIYVLNFLKILTEKGYLRHFFDCCKMYRDQYNEDNGIVPKTIVKEIRDVILKLNKELGITFLISSHLLDELAKVVTKYGIINNRLVY